MHVRIGEIARAAGTDAPTIRYYEATGILPRPERTPNSYRDYGEEDLRRIKLVVALRRLGVAIDEIRSLSSTCLDHRCATTTRELLAIIDRRSREVHEQIEDLRGLADRFAELRRHLTSGRRTAMSLDVERAPARDVRVVETACDCGCSGSGCACGCACCGLAEQKTHGEHERVLEVLSQAPENTCDCGCCP